MKKGSTEACWGHFIANLNSDLIPHLAAIAKVGIPAVKRWVREKRLPIATELLALRHFLDFIGYEVKELKEFDVVHNRISLLIAFGPLSIEEIAEYATYTSKDHLLRVFRGISINAARKQLLMELCDGYEAEVNKNRSELIEKVRAIAKLSNEPPTKSEALDQEVVETAANAVQAAYQALEPFINDESTRHDRELLRAKVISLLGSDGMSGVWERINILLSESAFEKRNKKNRRNYVS